jgi:flagellar basal body-associated protein FliL
MKKLFPVLIALAGLGGGVAAGTVMKPADDQYAAAEAGQDGHDGHDKASKAGHDGHTTKAAKSAESSDDILYVGLEKPFFVPVIQHGRANTLVRLDIHLEVPTSLKEGVKKHDPKLRDAFLRTVMNFSHEGGFSRVHGGEGFTILRDDLLVSARQILGPNVKTVLIGEILTRES